MFCCLELVDLNTTATNLQETNRKKNQKERKNQMDLPKYFPVFLKNLPIGATQEHVMGLFKNHGSIHSVKVVPNKNDSNSRCAYVNFHELESALAAVRIMKTFKWGENQVEVNLVKQVKKPTDFRPFTDCKYSQECSPADGNVSSNANFIYTLIYNFKCIRIYII